MERGNGRTREVWPVRAMVTKITSQAMNGRLKVTVRMPAATVIAQQELETICAADMRAFLKPTQIKNGILSCTMEYVGALGISLSEWLVYSADRKTFFDVVRQIADMSVLVQRKGLYASNLVLEPGNIFINGGTKLLQFIYCPVEGKHVYADFTGLVQRMLYIASASSAAAAESLKELSGFMDGMPEFDAARLTKFLDGLSDRPVTNTNRGYSEINAGGYGSFHTVDPNAGTTVLVDDDDQADDADGTSILQGNASAAAGAGADADGTSILRENASAAAGADADGTRLLNEEDEGTIWLDEGSGVLAPRREPASPVLLRLSNNETVRVDKPVFRIGKERSYVDYFISNNNAISRSHADIITREGRFYICDRNSKNRSYINGQPLPPNVEVEMRNGEHIRLADENFIFNF